MCLGTAECRHVFWFSAGNTPVVSLVVGVVMLPGSFVIHWESFYWFCWQSLKVKAGPKSGIFLECIIWENLQWQKGYYKLNNTLLDLYFIKHKTIYIHFKIEHIFETCYLLSLWQLLDVHVEFIACGNSPVSLGAAGLKFYTRVIDILIKHDEQKLVNWKSQLSVKA